LTGFGVFYFLLFPSDFFLLADDVIGLCDSPLLDNAFPAINCVLHMLVEEREDFFRMSSEIVVAILEAPGGALDSEQFLFFAAEKIEDLLRVLRILCL
jgi:hypothetical protein